MAWRVTEILHLVGVGRVRAEARGARPASASQIPGPRRTLTNTEHMLAALPDPTLCVGEDPPVGRPQLDGQEPLVEELAELVWLSLAEGGDSQTRARAERLVGQVRRLPSSPEAQSLLADALIVLAHTQIVDGDLALAERHLHEAARTAERIEADGIRARAMVDLGWTLANIPGRADDAVVVLEDAAALLERTGNPEFESERQQQALGEALLASGDHQRARVVFEAMLREIDLANSKYPPDATTLMGLSRVAAAERKHARALEYAEQALAVWERKLGGAHPLLAAPLTNIGQAHAGLGNQEAARAALERSISLRRAQLEGESTSGNRSRLAEVIINLANLDSMSGNADAAANGYREALALVPEHDYSNRALALFNLGVDHQIAGRLEQALVSYQEALRLAERVHPMDSRQVVGARLGVGSTLVTLGRAAEARGPLERCSDDLPASMIDTADEGELRFGLARTLEALDGWSPRVESLVADASAIYLRQDMRATVAEIDAWVADQRP
jgi:tetratricopeptide (TPR) repeat protein